MKKMLRIVSLVAVLGAAQGADPDTLERLYQAALHMETANADYKGAIPVYGAIISNHEQNVAIAVRALHRQGVCYEKTGRAELARQCAESLAGQYGAEANASAEIREWLARHVELSPGGKVAAGARKSQGPTFQELSRILLPERPDRDQVRNYISLIAGASEGQQGFSCADPQVTMLAKVGKENLSLLLEALHTHPRLNYPLEFAIAALADEHHRQLIVEALPDHPRLIYVIIRNGWEKDVRAVLLAELRSHKNDSLPEGWLRAAANLKDPAMYPILLNHFVNGTDNYNAYQAIKDLPVGDLRAAVDKAWSRRERGADLGIAMVAALYGHMDALQLLIDEFLVEVGGGYRHWGLRETFEQVFEFRGSEAAFAKWLKRQRDHLRYDPKSMKYVPDGTVAEKAGVEGDRTGGVTDGADQEPAACRPALCVGDPAPALRTGEWIRGEPVAGFSRDKAYLIEFWNSYPGVDALQIRHINALAAKFRDKGLVVIGQNVHQRNEFDAKSFVEKMGDAMNYRVALDAKSSIDADGEMVKNWLQASGEADPSRGRPGIPCVFLVGKDGRIAWIGHPSCVTDTMIEQVLAGTFDLEASATARRLNRH